MVAVDFWREYNGVTMTREIHLPQQPSTGEVPKPSLADDDVDRKERKLTFGEDEMELMAKVQAFIALDVDELFTRPLESHEVEMLRSAATFTESKPDTANRRLAMAMMGLEKAVRTLYYARDWSAPDVQSVNASTVGEFTVDRAGSDFGMNMSFEYPIEGRVGIWGKPLDAQLYALLPPNHYLFNTLRFGDPHEPQFFAREPDLTSQEWSEQYSEWLENGGRTYRRPHFDRAIYDDEGRYIADSTKQRGDVYLRDAIDYAPLYNEDAPGAHRYVAIIQELLVRFLEAAGKR